MPYFQRAYAWQREHVEQLYTHILKAHRRDFGIDWYPLGFIILAKAVGSEELLLTDGHQRLITLTTLLACLRDLGLEDDDPRVNPNGGAIALGHPVGATGAIPLYTGRQQGEHMASSGGYNKMFPVSWTELHRDARALAWRLADLGPFKGIVAITRGGMVPAAIIARELNLRLIDTVCLSTYDRMERGANVQLLKGTSAEGEKGKGWLLIDDLVDTGVTAKAVRALLPEAHFATVYAKPAGRPNVDSFITEVSQDTWILFPWDQEAVMAKTIVELKGGQ